MAGWTDTGRPPPRHQHTACVLTTPLLKHPRFPAGTLDSAFAVGTKSQIRAWLAFRSIGPASPPRSHYDRTETDRAERYFRAGAADDPPYRRLHAETRSGLGRGEE